MEVILSAIGDLGVDRLPLTLAATPLCLSELVLEIAVNPSLRQLRPVGALGRNLRG